MAERSGRNKSIYPNSEYRFGKMAEDILQEKESPLRRVILNAYRQILATQTHDELYGKRANQTLMNNLRCADIF